MHQLTKRRLTMLAAALGAACVAAVPLAASADTVPTTIGDGGSGTAVGAVWAGTCSSVPAVDVSSDFGGTATYAGDAEATATTTSIAVAVGTTVNCAVYDKTRKTSSGTPWVWGTFSGGDPGSAAAAAGLVTLTAPINPAVCIWGSAVFSDGTFVNFNNCPSGVS